MSNKYLDFTGLSTYDQKIKEYIGEHGTPVDKTLTQEDEAADAKVTGEAVEEAKGAAVSGTYDIDFTKFEDTVVPYTISGTNTVTKSSNNYTSYQIPRDAGYSNITVTAPSDYISRITFLKEQISPSLANGASIASALATGETGRHEIVAGTTAIFTLPNDCTYIIVSKISNAWNITPSAFYYITDIKKDLDDLTVSTEIDTTALKNAVDSGLQAFPVMMTPKTVIATTDEAANDIPIAGMNLDIQPAQSGSGDPSPENIRPFIGFDKITVCQTGDNLYGGNYLFDVLANSPAHQGFTPDVEAQTVIIRGSYVGSNPTYIGKTFKPDTRYTVILTFERTSGKTSLGYTNFRIVYTDGTGQRIAGTNQGLNTKQTCVVVSEAGKSIKSIRLYNDTETGQVKVYCSESGVFEGVITADKFKPYNGKSYAVSIPSTVYGGNLNYSNGAWSFDAYVHYAEYAGEALSGRWLSSEDVYTEGTSPAIGAEVIDLETTSSIQPTGEDIKTYDGLNNIFADRGDITVEYRVPAVNTEFNPFEDNPYALSVADHVSAMSNGHVKYYTEMSGIPMKVYGSDLKVKTTVSGSEYIRLKSTDIINIMSWYVSSATSAEMISSYNNEFYIYFYDSDRNVIWDILDYTDASTGEKNRITAAKLREINGLQFTNVPNGYYVRIANIGSCNTRLALWDGQKFGMPTSAYSAVWNSEGTKEAMPTDGSSCIALPEYGTWAIAKPGYTFLRGYTSTSGDHDKIPSDSVSSWFPSQVVRLTGITGAGRSKNLVIVKDYNYSDGTYSKDVLAGDTSDYVVIIDHTNTYSYEKPTGWAHRIIKAKADNLTKNWVWEAKADVVTNTSGSFRTGCTYHGVPYRSSWGTASYVGWHVTKQTFMSSANDPDSFLYHPNSSVPGPQYCLVCSSFGMLVAGFDYPATNYSIMLDPNIAWFNVKQPAIGELCTNGYGHCIIPLERYVSGENNHYAVKITESGSPYAKTKVVFDGVDTTWGGIGSDATYIDYYNVVVYPKRHAHNYNTPYNIESYTLKSNATAKPRKGDQSVYTSAEAVTINIKDPTANRLYYQRFNATCSRGMITSIAPITGEDPEYITFEPGTTRVTLRSKTSSGTYTGANLVHEGIYGVWLSTDDSQTTAPTEIEYFEWHDMEQERITYNIQDGKLVTNDEFWYVVVTGENCADPYYRGHATSGLISIPYEPPAISMDGETVAQNSDYSKYRERFMIVANSTKPIWAFFRKGKFGAYVVSKEEGTDPPDPEPDNPTP